jgi:hypothetical protein
MFKLRAVLTDEQREKLRDARPSPGRWDRREGNRGSTDGES